MNVSVEKLPKSEVKLTIELTEEEHKKYYEKAAQEISTMVKIPGFRPGKAPVDVVEKNVKEGAIEAHMIDLALPATYSDTVKKENIQVVTRPKIKILQNSPLKYEAVAGVYPEVKISGYDKITIKKEEVKIEDADVDHVITDVQKRFAKYKEVDRPAQKGDKLEIDFEGFDEGGAQLENTISKNHPLVLGEGSLVPGFEDQLIGMKKEENKEFDVKFPKDYFHKPFQDKTVKFKVHVHKVEEVELPEMTAEFIKTISGEEKTLDEIKANIRENLQHDREHNEKVRQEDEFLNKIAEMVDVEIPNALMEEEIDSMMEEFKSEIESRGITIEQYLEGTKKEIKDLRDQRKKEAEKRLRLRFALQKIFEQEKIEATEEDINHEIEHIKSLYPENEREKVDEEYKIGSYLRTRLANKIKMDKMFAAYINK